MPPNEAPRLSIVAVKPVCDEAGKLLGSIEQVVGYDGKLARGQAVFVPVTDVEVLI